MSAGPCSAAGVTAREDAMKWCLLAPQVLPRVPASQRHTQEALSLGSPGEFGATLKGHLGLLATVGSNALPDMGAGSLAPGWVLNRTACGRQGAVGANGWFFKETPLGEAGIPWTRAPGSRERRREGRRMLMRYLSLAGWGAQDGEAALNSLHSRLKRETKGKKNTSCLG